MDGTGPLAHNGAIEGGVVKGLWAGLAFAGALCGVAVADDAIPLPRPRPATPFVPMTYAEAAAGLTLPAEITHAPSACRARLDAIATVEALPHLIGPSECGGGDMVRLSAALLPGGKRIPIVPAPELRCEMAEAIAAWLRDEVAPTFADNALASVENYDSYECRGRNRIVGAKTSEHGKGNALDIRAFRLADGKRIEPTDMHVVRDLREKLRTGACSRFTTVLGPGSDGYHESHIHLDLAERRGGYRMCQWAVRDLPKAVAQIPLPLPRPNFPAENGTVDDKRKL